MPMITIITVYTCYSQVVKLKNKTVSNFKEIGRNLMSLLHMYKV